MKNIAILFFLLLPKLLLAQQPKQFVLFDTEFTFTKENADNSKPSKSHYYVTGNMLNTQRPTDWTTPVDYRNGTVHIRLEVLEKPAGNLPTTWTLCYIPNEGQGNGYGCTNTGLYTKEGIYQSDVPMTLSGKTNPSSGPKVLSKWT